MPSSLNMPNLEVTKVYRDGFMNAVNTVLHQLVFDPISKTLKPLTPYEDGFDHSNFPFCGEFFGHERALQIALGNVNVQSGKVIDNYIPKPSNNVRFKLVLFIMRCKIYDFLFRLLDF